MKKPVDDEVLGRVREIETMADFRKELRQRRFRAGFNKVSDLLRSIKGSARLSLPRTTAYDLETGNGRCGWGQVETYLRACGATNDEIALWQEVHQRATDNHDRRGAQATEEQSVPTAGQLAELGPEQAARILGAIAPTVAADLLRRIDIKRAVVVVPELSPELAVELIGLTSRSRAVLLFENIATDRGAELLSEFTVQEAADLLDDLDTRRVAELLAAMPRGRATRLLRDLDRSRTVRLLVEMRSQQAGRLLNELDPELTAELAATAPARKVAAILAYLDPDVATNLIATGVPEPRALELLCLGSRSVASVAFDRMDRARARHLLTRMPTAVLGEMFDSLGAGVRRALLSDILDPASAAAVFAHSSGEGFTFALEDYQPARIAAMIDAAGPPEGVLWLACLRTMRKVVLDAMPEERAEYFTAQLAPERLAAHLAAVDKYRAVEYLTELDGTAVPSDELLALMSPGEAVSIVIAVGDFQPIARWLERLPVSHVRDLLLAGSSSQAAHILSHVELECAARALAALDPISAERVLEAIADQVTFRTAVHGDLSATEFDALCETRRTRLSELRRRLASTPSG